MNRALRVPDYLDHIREAIERIFQYVEDLDENEFERNRLVQDAVVRNLEIIGEASRNIERADAGFVAAHPELEFSNARALRNWLTHGYYRVNLHVVWLTVQDDLSVMHAHIVAILRDFPDPAP